jgi:hypothetical protein
VKWPGLAGIPASLFLVDLETKLCLNTSILATGFERVFHYLKGTMSYRIYYRYSRVL